MKKEIEKDVFIRAALDSGIGDSVIRVNWPIPTDLVVKTTDFNSQNESLTRVIN